MSKAQDKTTRDLEAIGGSWVRDKKKYHCGNAACCSPDEPRKALYHIYFNSKLSTPQHVLAFSSLGKLKGYIKERQDTAKSVQEHKGPDKY